MNQPNPSQIAFQRLLTIMDELREQCPWDRKQTIQTLRNLTIEETYELADAITAGDWNNMKEELGDLMLHLVFYAKIATEQNRFSIPEMINAVCEKLINRHPHIYSTVKVADDNDVKQNWEKIKQQEGKKSILSGIPAGMPALIKALRLQEKTKKVGFEWENTAQVKNKVDEELGELDEAVLQGEQDEMENEMGDVLFALINYSRFINVDPERALEKTNRKFIRRFTRVEEMAAEQGKTLHDMTLWELDALWNKVKETESKK